MWERLRSLPQPGGQRHPPMFGKRQNSEQSGATALETIINVDHLPGDLTVPSFGARMVCTKCGTIGADVRPNWQEKQR